MADIMTIATDLHSLWQQARPNVEAVHLVLQHAYAIVQDLTPLLILLMFLLLLRCERRMKDITRRQEQQTRTLLKLLNLHPDSDYQQYIRLAEQRARERDGLGRKEIPLPNANAQRD